MSLTRKILADRLRQAREAAGLSQADTAKALGVARPVVSQIETSDRKVSSIELDQLARLFGRLPADLLEAEFNPEESLLTAFRAVGTAELEVDLQREVIRRCREVAAATRQLEAALGIQRAFDGHALATRLATPQANTWQAIQQGERAAIEERRRLGLGSAPVPDLMDLLESQGILTALLDLPEEVDGLTLMLRAGPFIAVNRRERNLPRRRFSLAHEYAHVILDSTVRASVTHRNHQDEVREKRANRFAAAFLLPEEGVTDMLTSLGKPPRENTSTVMEGEMVYSTRNSAPASESEIQPHDVVQLSHYFGASHLAVLYRLKSLSCISEHTFDELHGSHKGGKLRELAHAMFLFGPEAPSESTPDHFHHRFVSLVLEALRRDEISVARASEFAGLVGYTREEFRDLLRKAGFRKPIGRVRNPNLGA